jgi:hypothetical protein
MRFRRRDARFGVSLIGAGRRVLYRRATLVRPAESWALAMRAAALLRAVLLPRGLAAGMSAMSAPAVMTAAEVLGGIW